MFKNQNSVMINVKGLEKSFHLQKIFDNIQFEIKNGEKIGLVGLNGTGKTTLANLILGKILPDKGVIEKPNDVKIGYLTQSIDYEGNDFYQFLSNEAEYDLFHRTSELGLRKVSNWEESRLSHLSGGEKLKLALSMVWASKPDVLILDEPTNHLDFTGIKWLVSELEKFHGPVLLISHDRHFLDQTVNRIFELENGKIGFYNGNYSDYRKEKQQRLETQRHQYNVQQRQTELVETQMVQLKSWSEKAHRNSRKEEGTKEYHRVKAKKRDNQVKSKMKRLQNELNKNKVEKPIDEAKVRFEFDQHGKRGKRILEAKRLSKSFDDRTLFQDSQFYINQGERIGLLGENGCGKTTLIKMINGMMQPSEGELWKSDTINIAYLSQDVADLPADLSAMEALGYSDRESILKARTLLANLGLKEGHITKPIGTLSLGQRTRVKLVDILMKEYDVLILDEPTNHLDLPSREQLEKTLKEYTGTILTVSHDFYFLNNLCDRLLVFDNQQIKRVEMKPEEYFKTKTIDNRNEKLLVIENKIAAILGELSLINQKDPKYHELDKEFNDLVKQKRALMG
ncbi:ABC-F type ribosomal protection protein [Neobacillus sp. MM2021_6]|uniref:ribosomal protection-like ABC-F family protein n=1 Tax=Bacillaceae TaxID=186817 RepID=UPI00140C3979|nr:MULTISPECIES: ABC-F type ribosomal protection protein [Bacillaceae]MBO0960178.1 ABC-F type ribosomal protection protein [Neobacillus sp. MM2021_6]NHC18591.1 ABC-F type ribosomal protection protein [Bacillus sp. MM2020_4]